MLYSEPSSGVTPPTLRRAWLATGLVIACVGLAEFGVMELLQHTVTLPTLALNAIDALLLTVTLTPVLVVLLHRPYQRALTLHQALYDQVVHAQYELQALVDAAADGLIATDNQLQILVINEVAASILGLDRHEAVGQRVDQLIDFGAGGAYDAAGDSALDAFTIGGARAEARTLVGQRRTPDGAVHLVEATRGDVLQLGRLAYVYVLRDVTNRAVASEQRESRERLEMLGRLAGAIAHDFNNLLQVVRTNIHFASLSVASDSETSEDLAIATSACERANELTTQLLSLGRPSRGDDLTIDVRALIHEIKPLLRAMTLERIRVELDVPEGLPQVRGERAQVQQALLNLAANARDAMPHGGTLTIRAAATTNDLVEIAVMDTGHGIPDDLVERVWEPFFTTKVAERTGLGLTTVRANVLALGGQVALETAVGVGTTVRLSLRTATAPLALERPPSGELPPTLGGARVLVVEDEPEVLRIATRVLEGAGYSVITASSGEEALGLLRDAEVAPDIAVLDVLMHGLHGCALRMQMVRVQPSLRWLDVTGFDPRSTNRCCNATTLHKPFTPEALLDAVALALATNFEVACAVGQLERRRSLAKE